MKKGFTLIELLVVIAIIGILSSIAIINLNSARQRAQTAQAQGALSSLASIAVLCLDGEGELNCGAGPGAGNAAACAAAGDTIPASLADICVGAAPGPGNTWPTLQGTWGLQYALSDHTAGTFEYYASEGTNAGDDGFNCSESGCQRDVFPRG